MIKSERIAEFMSWTIEERDLCACIHFRNVGSKPSAVEMTEQPVAPRKRRVAVKRENSCKPWTDDEDLAILEIVGEYGAGNKAWGMLSRELKRSRKAIGVRYYATLNKKINKTNGGV
jgi:hypothetical protein